MLFGDVIVNTLLETDADETSIGCQPSHNTTSRMSSIDFDSGVYASAILLKLLFVYKIGDILAPFWWGSTIIWQVLKHWGNFGMFEAC